MLISFPVLRNQAVERSPGKAAAEDIDLFYHIVESATDFAVFAQDESGNVVTWNVGAERLIGYSEQEIVGQSGDVIFTPEDRSFGPAMASSRSCAIAPRSTSRKSN
jgi:PAS domain S-box-containing protein